MDSRNPRTSDDFQFYSLSPILGPSLLLVFRIRTWIVGAQNDRDTKAHVVERWMIPYVRQETQNLVTEIKNQSKVSWCDFSLFRWDTK